MTYREFTGKTVREAIRKAAEELSVEESLLDVEVLEESSRGFLGIVGQKDARIKARKRDILKEVMQMGEQNDDSLSAYRDEEDNRAESLEATPEPNEAQTASESLREADVHGTTEELQERSEPDRPEEGASSEPTGETTPPDKPETEPKKADQPKEGGRRRGRGPRRPRERKRRAEPVPTETVEENAPPEAFESEPYPEEDVEPVNSGPAMGEAKVVLEEMLKRMPVETEVRAQMSNGIISLDIKGDGSGLLIGKKGQTLDALQFLVNKIVNKTNAPGEKVEVVVDTEDYRMRKRENLREKAQKLCQKVRKTQKPAWFDPMPASERRIIHMILAEEKDVYTKSHGEGPRRRIVVYPRKGALNKRRGR